MQPNFDTPEFREFIKEVVSEILAQIIVENEKRIRDISLVERLIRVEEELKALREIQIAQFEAINKRFETLEKANQQRFEAIEKRLNFIQWFIAVGFTFLAVLITIVNFVK